MKKNSTRNMILAGLFVALGIVLPFFTGKIGELGRALLPMHIPVLIAGFVSGWPYGLAVGLITPFLSSFTTGMPPVPMATTMTFELAAYGFLTGLLYKLFPKKDIYVYPALLLSMLGGRLVLAAANLIMMGLQGEAYTFKAFMAGAFLNAIPGIIIQIVIIPLIIIGLKRSGLIYNEK